MTQPNQGAAMLELAEQLEARAVERLRGYLSTGESRSAWDGSNRLSEAEHLLNCAAALRAKAAQ